MIGVTGASGHLGREIMRQLPTASVIGRIMPIDRYEVIIHCAAPNYRDDDDVRNFHGFIEDLHEYTHKHRPRLVIVGSWWQYAQGTCRNLPYTLQKTYQTFLFPQATHVVPYSIYGDNPRDGRGFIPHLVEALQGRETIHRVSHELRDFIHVSDAARACILAISAPAGIYSAQTRTYLTPEYVAQTFGITAQRYDEQPTAHPNMTLHTVPGWEPEIDVLDHVTQMVAASHPTAT